jgi:hypothetical protein
MDVFPVAAGLGHGGSRLRGERMNLRKTYTSLLTADLAAAEGWYTRLLGR